MLSIGNRPIWLFRGWVDMRCQADRLAQVVEHQLGRQPYHGDQFHETPATDRTRGHPSPNDKCIAGRYNKKILANRTGFMLSEQFDGSHRPSALGGE